MKKLILSFILLLMSASAIYAQSGELKVLLFADTYDERIGNGERVSVQKFKAFMEQVHAITDMPMAENYKVYDGYDCNPDTLKAVVKRFRCSKEDVVVFCYLGHGIRSEKDSSIFPQMCLAAKYEKDYVPLEWVKHQLADKGPRLCVIIGDCCNSYGDWVTDKDYTALGSGSTALASSQINAISKLFNESGGVTVCASQPGEQGWSHPEKGSEFLNTFMSTVRGMPTNKIGQENIWRAVLGQVYTTLSNARIYGKDHQYHSMHPQYRIEKRRTGIVTPPPTPRVEHANDLETAMKQLSQVQYSQRDRMVEDVMNRYFDRNAWVRVVGQNGTLMRKVKAAEYLSGLYTKTRLFKVVVRSRETDANNRITTLTVHEMYMEQ